MSQTPHLDDEVLSAILDGEATIAESAHVDTCAECSARLATLRDASLLVRMPVTPAADADRERAIAAALAALPSNVVPLRARRVPPVWLTAAAVLVVAVVSVALLGRGGDDDDDGSDVAASDTGESAGQVADEMTMAAPAPSVVDGGDLGTIDVASLEEVVRGSLLGGTSSAREEDAVATTTSAGPSDGTGGGGTSGTTTCEAELRTANAELGQLTFRATGTLDDEPVVVLVFDVVTADGRVDRWIYVAARDGCAVRNQQTLRG